MSSNNWVRSTQQGLTLVEVLVALFIVAVVAAITVQVIGRAADIRLASADRALAQLCADNLLVEQLLQQEWPDLGRKEGQQQQGLQQCYWRINVEATPLPGMRRINIHVFASAQREQLLAQVSGFVGNK